MIEVARREHPGLRFEVGSMTDLDLADGSVTGLLAFYSLIHIPDDEIATVLAHFRRVLRPGGPLLLGFHVGDERPAQDRGLRRPPDEASTCTAAGPPRSRPGCARTDSRSRPQITVTSAESRLGGIAFGRRAP